MTKADYSYNYFMKDNLLAIVDLNLGNKSVTNDAKAVLNEIQNLEPDIEVNHTIIAYRDSNGHWEKILPKWRNEKCVNVDFSSWKESTLHFIEDNKDINEYKIP